MERYGATARHRVCAAAGRRAREEAERREREEKQRRLDELRLKRKVAPAAARPRPALARPGMACLPTKQGAFSLPSRHKKRNSWQQPCRALCRARAPEPEAGCACALSLAAHSVRARLEGWAPPDMHVAQPAVPPDANRPRSQAACCGPAQVSNWPYRRHQIAGSLLDAPAPCAQAEAERAAADRAAAEEDERKRKAAQRADQARRGALAMAVWPVLMRKAGVGTGTLICARESQQARLCWHAALHLCR